MRPVFSNFERHSTYYKEDISLSTYYKLYQYIFVTNRHTQENKIVFNNEKMALENKEFIYLNSGQR